MNSKIIDESDAWYIKKAHDEKWKDLWNVISHKIFEFKKKLNLWTFIFKLNADALNP